MKKNNLSQKITNPEDLNNYLESTKPITWIILFSVIICLVGLFVWSFFAKITFKIYGTALIESGEVTLNIEESKLSELKVGQEVYISSQKGEILNIKEDGYPVISTFTLDDGQYDYYIVIKETKPVDYFFNK